jgi:hypothetical protein
MNRRGRNRYKNRLGIPWLSYTVILGLIVLAFGCSYVFLKNQHHLKEREKLAINGEIEDLKSEILKLRNLVLAAGSAETLKPRIENGRSNLEPIPTAAVLVLDPAGKKAGAATTAQR